MLHSLKVGVDKEAEQKALREYRDKLDKFLLPEGEPPLLSDEQIKELTGHTTSYEHADTQISYSLNKVREVAQAQRESDIKFYKGGE